MILAVSRFRVANGLEREVAEAFLRRPHLVDAAPGFLGMETFTEAKDPTVFFLVTRWTDADSFQTWHKSPDHHASHKFIPKGLKLDPSFTRVTVMDRLTGGDSRTDLEESVVDAAPFIARYFESSKSIHYLSAALDGVVVSCSQSVITGLSVSAPDLIGSSLWRWLPENDAASLREKIADGRRLRSGFLLNFSDFNQHPYSLNCHLDVYPHGFVLIGEVPLQAERLLQQQLIGLNNELSVLMRENARQNKALTKAQADLTNSYDELKNSNWHLKKIQELLPICMGCGKVKTGDTTWDDLTTYFKQNSAFLSHSYCPDCGDHLAEQWGLKGS